MLNQFSRTQLIIGKENQDSLANKTVAIFGIGGVGGYVAEALARSGIGNFVLIDADKVCLTNINRQIIATTRTYGLYKCDVMEQRIHDINPRANVEVHKCFFMPDTADQFDFSKYDYVIDAVDTVTAKLLIIEMAIKSKVKVISAMGAGNKINPTMLEVSDIYKTRVDPLAKVMRTECRKRRIKKLKVVYSKEKPIRPSEDASISCRADCVCPPGTRKCTVRRDIPGSTAFVPSAMGLIIAAEVVKDFTGIKNDRIAG